MRSLKAKDIGPFIRIIGKMELKEVVRNMFNGQKEQGEMVTELVWGIVENYHKVESDLFKFLGELEGKTAKEIADLPVSEFIDLLMALFSKENLPFFKLAAK